MAAKSLIFYQYILYHKRASAADPDLYVFGPPGSGSVSQRYGSGSDEGSESCYHQAKIVRETLIPTVL
jgi:hypothetical protein